MLKAMHLVALAAIIVLAACGPAPAPVASSRADAAQDSGYSETIKRLTAMNRQAEALYQSGKSDDAAKLVTQGESLAARLLRVPHPTLPALEAVSDLDDLYGRMLLANRNYGWARLEFQKNRARWKNWRPQTPETEQRFKQANAAIAECDRHLGE
jgi:hypothetical protein